MAPPVAEHSHRPGYATRLWGLIRDPVPGRLSYALRMAAGCTTTVLAGEIWQVPDLGVPTLVTLALWQKDRVANIVVGVVLNLFMIMLLAIIYGVVHLTLDQPVTFVAAIAALTFCFFFLGSASKLKPVAYILGLLVIYGLVAIEEVPVGEVVTRTLLYTDLFLLVPGLVMVILGLLICPSPRQVAAEGIAVRLRVCAALLRGPSPKEQTHATLLLRAGGADMLKALRMARLEHLWKPADLACLNQAANTAVTLLALAHAAQTEDGRAPQELITTLEDMADIFSGTSYPVDITAPDIPSTQPALHAIAALLTVLSVPEAQKPPDKTEKEKKAGFFAPDAFSNPDHVRFALKGTAAVMISYVFFRAVNWSGIHTCIITCFIVALPTTGEMISKLTLRIVGACIGGAIGILSIIFILPHTQEITGFLVLMFVVSLLAAWIKAGDERIAYAGFQIGLAFYLSDLTGYGPTTDMTTARDRIVGILVGNFITYAVFTTLWPASAYAGIAPCLRTVAAHLEKLRRTVGLQARANVMAGLQSALSLGERQVEYALAEPLHMRRTMKNLGALHNAFATAERIGIDILEDAPSDPAHRIAALEKLTA